MAGQAITDPACLADCFADSASTADDCFASLIVDVTTDGTCTGATGNPATELNIWGASTLGNNCTLEEEEDYYYPDDDSKSTFTITDGTCSTNTETLLQTTECQTFLEQQPNIVQNTLELLIQHSCKKSVYENLPISSARLGIQTAEITGNYVT